MRAAGDTERIEPDCLGEPPCLRSNIVPERNGMPLAGSSRPGARKAGKSSPEFAIQELLRADGAEFSPKQRILVDFLHRNYQKVAFMSITELAKETKVSEATIVRLAAMLKFDGYPGLQKAVQRIVSQELTTMDRMQLSLELNVLDNPMKQMLNLDLRNISRLYQRVGDEDVRRLRTRLVEARHVVVLGVMASSPLATYFGYELNRCLRRVTTLTEDNLMAKRTISELTSKDLLVVIGFPRYPAAIIRLLATAGERKAQRVVITDTSASPLVKYAEQRLFVPFDLWSFVDSLAAPMSFLAGIVADIVKHEPELTAQRLKEFETLAARFELFHHEA